MNELNYDQKTIAETSKILNDILDDVYNQEYKNIKNNQHVLYHKHKSKKKPQKEEKTPSALITGGIEVACGALLWITPFRPVGTFLIGDGIRRMLNTTEEIDKQNEQKELDRTKETIQTKAEKQKSNKLACINERDVGLFTLTRSGLKKYKRTFRTIYVKDACRKSTHMV